MTRPLFTVQAAPANLKPRQSRAWEMLQTRPCTASEIGASIHAAHGRHGHSERCDYCHVEGMSVLTSKALAPHVTYSNVDGRRVYRPRHPQPRASAQLDDLPDDLFGGP